MWSSLRTLVVLAVLLAAPVSASAGLNLEAPTSYMPGDVITITVAGDSEGREAVSISLLMTVDEELTLVSVNRGTLYSSDSSVQEWMHAPVSGTCGTIGLAANQCFAVDAFTTYTGQRADLLPSTLTTWQFDTTGATGDLVVLLEPDGVGFFGFPGTQVTVTMIPEPASVALLCAGLVALAARRRARGREAARVERSCRLF